MPASRAFLEGLADVASGRAPHAWPADVIETDALAAWLRSRQLAAPAFALARVASPELAARLRGDALAAAAGNLARFHDLELIERRFSADGIAMIVLKGAAVASAAYADPALRPMIDLDLWVRDEDMARAADCLRDMGYREAAGLPHRPPELQRRSGGEVIFCTKARRHGLVELHYSAFQGWWIRRAAGADADAVWARSIPLAPGRHARRLGDEDAVLQTSFHVVVNQFSQAPLRGMLDVAVMARARDLDWSLVAERARAWRLATAVGLVLDTAGSLFGLPGASAALEELRPRGVQRALLSRFVTPASVLAGRDLTRRLWRHPFLLSLVDRPRDAARLVGRALWPEAWWREARYGRPVGPAGHLWSLLRRGEL